MGKNGKRMAMVQMPISDVMRFGCSANGKTGDGAEPGEFLTLSNAIHFL